MDKAKQTEKSESKKKTREAEASRPKNSKGIKTVFTIGKRKRAIARATFRPGTGKIEINSIPIGRVWTEMARLKLNEPLLLSGDGWKRYDISVNVRGGGLWGQCEASRQAIARGLVQLLGSDLKRIFTEYDRNLLVYDPRRTEPHKPPHSSWGPRRYKQRSKR